jgi:hypothetical protein
MSILATLFDLCTPKKSPSAQQNGEKLAVTIENRLKISALRVGVFRKKLLFLYDKAKSKLKHYVR